MQGVFYYRLIIMADKLGVIIKAKDLCEYIFLISDKSPKKFRMTLTLRMQNLSLDIIDNLMRANNIRLDGTEYNTRKRRQYQQQVKSYLDILCSIAEIAMHQQCIQSKHFTQICLKSAETRKLLESWVRSDSDRLKQIELISDNYMRAKNI